MPLPNEPDTNISDWIIAKNNQYIVFNKPATYPVQPDKSEDKSLLDLGSIYAKSNLQLVHRLDRPASGIVVMAKNSNALANINLQFQERKIKKTYLAVVAQLPKPGTGTLEHHLVKKSGNKSIIVKPDHPQAQKATLHYKHIGSIDNYHLLEIDLVTGRHHQIRAQLAEIGSPIKGDVKYGARRKNRDRSIHLHAWKLSFAHPVNKEQINLTAPIPKDSVWDAFGI